MSEQNLALMPSLGHPPFTGRHRLGQTPARVPSQDGRSAEARLMRRTRAELVAHVGGKPSATQAALINRAVMLTLQLARMDAKALAIDAMTDHDSRVYLAWSNTLTRTLRTLGLEGAPKATPSLADIFASSAQDAA